MRNSFAVLLLAASTAAAAADLPRYWTVHIDYAADRTAFEDIDKQFAAAQRDFYAAHNVDRPPGITFSTPDNAYYSLRPRGTFTDFDKPSPLGDAMKELQAKLAPISAATHKTLRTHHSEIWQIDRDLSNPGGERAPKYMVLRTDYVTPPNDEQYESAMKQLREELVAREIRVLAFFSTYGDGAYRYLFMSDQPVKIRTLGKLAVTRDVTARPRPDLSAIDAEHWLRYQASAIDPSR
jgi:hypothetical protein